MDRNFKFWDISQALGFLWGEEMDVSTCVAALNPSEHCATGAILCIPY